MRTIRWMAPIAVMLATLAPALIAAETANRILAFVNDDVITQGDLNSHLNEAIGDEQLAKVDAEQAQNLRQAMIERLIEERLLVQEAKKLGITVSSTDVVDRLQEIRQRLGTEDAYQQMLAEAHMTEEQLKLRLREQLLVQKAIEQKVRAHISVSPSEIAKAIKEHPKTESQDETRLYHVLVRVTDQQPEAVAQQVARDIRERLRHESATDQIDRDYASRAPAVETRTLDWVGRGQLLPELDQALAQLKVGEIAGPIRTRLGFHVVKVLDRRQASEDDAPTDPERAAEARVFQQKFVEAMQRWIKELKRSAYVRVLDS